MLRSFASYLGTTLVAALLLLQGCGTGEVLPLTLGVQRAFPGLTFTRPVAMLQAPNDDSRWFVVEQDGFVRVFASDPLASAFDTFIDIDGRVASGGEMGLLGMAFHPDFPANPRVYLSYTHEPSGSTSRVSRISEFMLGMDGRLDASSEQVLLTIRQPETNHNGGQIAFGPDGFLYIGMGDGGGANDQHPPIGNGQSMTTLLGKMLRIDVNPASGYLIPPTNRFSLNPQCGANGTGTLNCPEIYASGFRNPWRWSFDRKTGALWVGDVGQGMLEEIDRVSLGGNYGWRCFEGTLNTGLACGTEPSLLPPVAEYGRGLGTSVTGGYVYRGTAIPGLVGRYVFGDFTSGRILHFSTETQPTAQITGGFASGLSISSFGEGVDGELYVVHYHATNGALYRLTGS